MAVLSVAAHIFLYLRQAGEGAAHCGCFSRCSAGALGWAGLSSRGTCAQSL